jgi:hypothetical protein
VVNIIILSMLWYFVRIWVGMKEKVNKINDLLSNFLWGCIHN